VNKLATWPSQNTGTEIATNDRTINRRSTTELRQTAAMMPNPMLMTTHSTAAPSTSDRVTGAAASNSGTTFTPRLV